ncbi:MAG: LytTR family DNA-binding domain-containing protein [Cytophagales bacterium]|nr:LytTR family DNA-binding domain-containing protein [Cytophagales bacterium]
MNVIIIEDEPLMAEELASEVRKVDNRIQIQGKFRSVKETLNHLTRYGLPDLFFSDVQLSDGLSFEIFSQVEMTTPVIFCTAFDSYALEAFKSNGVDYLLKPLEGEEVRETILKYQKRTSQQLVNHNLYKDLMTTERNDQRSRSIIVHQAQKIFAIKYADIRLVYLKEGITYLMTNQGKQFVINKPLDKMEELLANGFYRANRQVLIHRDAISHIDSYFARKLLITPVYDIQMDIVVSKANAPHFLSWLEVN